jgi:phosphonate transport system substrate-binding protein
MQHRPLETTMMKRRKLLFGTAAVTASAFVPMARAQQVLTVGLIPSEDSRAMIANSQAMMDMLSKALGFAVKPFVAADYNGVIEALRSKRLDVAYLGPFSYVLGTTVAAIEAFAVAETKKAGPDLLLQPDRHAQGQRHQEVADLKGKTFAFVDPSSTSGHLFPKAGLMKLGFNPEKDFGRVIFSGSHDSKRDRRAEQEGRCRGDCRPHPRCRRPKGLVKPPTWSWSGARTRFPSRRPVWRKNLPADLKTRVQAAFLR